MFSITVPSKLHVLVESLGFNKLKTVSKTLWLISTVCFHSKQHNATNPVPGSYYRSKDCSAGLYSIHMLSCIACSFSGPHFCQPAKGLQYAHTCTYTSLQMHIKVTKEAYLPLQTPGAFPYRRFGEAVANDLLTPQQPFWSLIAYLSVRCKHWEACPPLRSSWIRSIPNPNKKIWFCLFPAYIWLVLYHVQFMSVRSKIPVNLHKSRIRLGSLKTQPEHVFSQPNSVTVKTEPTLAKAEQSQDLATSCHFTENIRKIRAWS